MEEVLSVELCGNIVCINYPVLFLSTCPEYETLVFMSLLPPPVTKITQKDMNRF